MSLPPHVVLFGTVEFLAFNCSYDFFRYIPFYLAFTWYTFLPGPSGQLFFVTFSISSYRVTSNTWPFVQQRTLTVTFDMPICLSGQAVHPAIRITCYIMSATIYNFCLQGDHLNVTLIFVLVQPDQINMAVILWDPEKVLLYTRTPEKSRFTRYHKNKVMFNWSPCI